MSNILISYRKRELYTLISVNWFLQAPAFFQLIFITTNKNKLKIIFQFEFNNIEKGQQNYRKTLNS